MKGNEWEKHRLLFLFSFSHKKINSEIISIYSASACYLYLQIICYHSHTHLSSVCLPSALFLTSYTKFHSSVMASNLLKCCKNNAALCNLVSFSFYFSCFSPPQSLKTFGFCEEITRMSYDS